MADILVFPVVGALFWFAWATLMSAYHLVGVDIGNFYHPDMATAWTPGIIGGSVGNGSMTGVIFLAISFMMITLIPKVPDMLKGLLLGEKFDFGSAIGEATGPVKTAWGMAGAPYLKSAQEVFSRDKAEKWKINLEDWIRNRKDKKGGST